MILRYRPPKVSDEKWQQFISALDKCCERHNGCNDCTYKKRCQRSCAERNYSPSVYEMFGKANSTSPDRDTVEPYEMPIHDEARWLFDPTHRHYLPHDGDDDWRNLFTIIEDGI